MTDSQTYRKNGHHKNGERSTDMSNDALSSFVFGKVQPQAVPLEEGVIGALMLDRNALDLVSEVLGPEKFYLEAHQHIYRAITDLAARFEPVDLLTVTECLKKSGNLDAVGGGYYLVELSNRVASAANIEAHARIIAQKYMQRELAALGTRTVRDAYEDTTDVFDMLQTVEEDLFRIGNVKSNASKSIAQLGRDVLERMERALEKEGITGVVSGISTLDNVTGGWQSTDMIVLAARPSMGKTSLAIGWMLEAALAGVPVQLFSLEMPGIQIHARMTSILSGVPLQGILRGFIWEDHGDHFVKRELTAKEWQSIQEAIEKISTLPIYIDDTPALSCFEIRARSRRAVQKHGVGLLIVDYLQLMTGGNEEKRGGNREQEVSLISRTIKNVAKTLNVPFIALSQLSRDVEKRGGSKRPNLSDLRDSGSIEQDCDVCIFVYRAEKYNITEDEQGNSLKGVGELIIEKHRNGSLETVQVGFEDVCAKFYDLSQKKSELPTPQQQPVFDPSEARPKTNEDIPF